MAKHQSAWETLFIEATFPYQCWIIKRELLWLPFVGWGLAGVRSIAIDRKSGVAAARADRAAGDAADQATASG